MKSLNYQDRPQREQTPPRSNVLTHGQRFSVRLALATGATLAALMGVQTLALQDQTAFAAAQTTSPVTEQIATTDDDQATVVISSASTIIQATLQPTAQPTTAVVVETTSRQPRPSTRSSR